ncbi:MAG TPA: glycosylase [Firmicutes bacterium]|nr:glycosylase [Bacillota bacterium]
MGRLPAWLENAVFYEIYPQSFQDSNGDGIGDIPGMIARLDYVASLGCNAIWVNPWYDSPFGDAGYDVRDYKKIAPRYGTNEDAKRFFDEVHARGMHVLIDLVPGHTSIDHPWFLQSEKAEKNEFSDRYIWSDSVWEATDLPCLRGISDRDGAAAVNFFSNQPALNYGYARRTRPWMMSPDSPAALATREAIKDVMRFWLDLGADGFRVDMAASLVKADEDSAETIKLWQDFRAFLDKEYPHCAMVSEWGVPAKSIEGGFHMDFMLHFGPPAYTSLFRSEHPFFSREGKGDIRIFLDAYLSDLSSTQKKGLICIPSGNHDMPRLARGRDVRDLKICFAFLLTMAGAPFIYYGDEIGMRYLEGLTSVEGGYDRTGSRSPMQWEKKEGFGFTSAKTSYIPFDKSEDAPSVEEQSVNSDSLLAAVKELLALRAAHKALQSFGEFVPVFAQKERYPFAYERRAAGERILVVLNPADREECAAFDCSGKVLWSVGGVPEDGKIPARSACVIAK